MLTACVNSPEFADFQTTGGSDIKLLILRKIVDQKQLDYREINQDRETDGYLSSMGRSGLVMKRKEQFNQAIDQSRPDFSAILLKTLGRELGNSGYVTALHQPLKSDLKNGLVVNFPEMKGDAYLDFQFSFLGYSSDNGEKYEPLIILYVRLTGNQGRELLYAQGFVYGQKTGLANYRYIATPEGKLYDFDGFIEMIRFPQKCNEALEDGLKLIAQEVAHDLKK